MNSVFKYCAPKQHYLESLCNNQVNFSHPHYLNDRAERAEHLILPYKRFCEDIRWGDESVRVFDDQAIASFTNCDSLGNPYFWEKYAADYSGFAIEYDRETLTNLPAIYCIPLFLEDVKYVVKPYDLDNYQNTFADAITGKVITIKDCINDFKRGDPKKLDYLFQYLRFIKLKTEWGQESESRMVIGQVTRRSRYLHINPPYGFNLDLPAGTIKSVTIGAKMSRYYRNAIIKQAATSGYIVHEQTE